MGQLDRVLRELDDSAVEATFEVGANTYQLFAYRSLGRHGTCVRWNLYEFDPSGRRPVKGLIFGMAAGAKEALEDVMQAASEHAATGEINPLRRGGRSFRPSPHD
ncbi:MAG: hypothetical protein JSV80_12865 [Acidobacteriota bacterium]|nr:MAG: hypothetical protein JSV80_12865 [Acidobacteriota bacterium]